MSDLTLDITGMSAAGEGIGRNDQGKVVFVAGAFPGDRVQARLVRENKGVAWAELVKTLVPSSDRVASRCSVPGCGGCALRGYSVAAQARDKRRSIVEALRRIGKVDVDGLLGDVASLGDGWRYRHRVRLHAEWTGRRYRLGYHARKSRDLVGLSECPVLWSELEQVAVKLGEAVAQLDQKAGLHEVELSYSRRDGRAAGRLVAHGDIEAYRRFLQTAGDGILSGIEVEAHGTTLRHGNLELRYDHKRASEFDLRYEPGVFTQANPEMNDVLVDAVLRAVRPSDGQRLLELHGGIGNFSLPLARAGAHVVLVERQRRAAILAQRNARGAGVSMDVRADTDAQAVTSLGDFDVVLLDPPRTGAIEAAQALAQATHLHRVVYVSCDAATLARDLAILTTGGWRVVVAQGFDLFPETPHVETLLLLER